MSDSIRVQMTNDPTRIGVLTGRTLVRGSRKLLQVQFPNGARWVPESQLRPVPDQLSPLEMLDEKKLGRPIDLRRTLTHVKLSGRLEDVIYSMEITNTDFYAFQFKPVIKILDSPSNRILIADEVGLGKTIEAGLIWTELRSRFDMRRLLVLCPAALREKWQHELSSKFGVHARICDALETLRILKDRRAHSRGFAIIASMQGLRPPRVWDDERNKLPAAKLARFLESQENGDRLVDLLVIDEAHHLRNAATKTHKLGDLANSVAEYSVFLTATPIHNRNDDLHSLLSLLDPDNFAERRTFAEVLEANKPLVRARDLVLNPVPDEFELRQLLGFAALHPLLKTNRQLRMIRERDLTPERLVRRDVRSRVAHRLETVNLLGHVVTRTRKRDVKEKRVIREPIAEFVPLSPAEEHFYELVTGEVEAYAMERNANERFLLAQPQRQMTSSMAASLRSWRNKRVDLGESEETGEGDDDRARATIGPLVDRIVRHAQHGVDLDQLIRDDSKYVRLRRILKELLCANPMEKVIVFSTFRATLVYLAERLTDDGLTCVVLMGGQREPKDETIQRFRDPTGPSILLSSEVGGEGVDLQFSRIVVNYDLPWNPMRIEQRIGRIDRLGQQSAKVTIWNILYEDTIDARIYNRLYDKLDLCRTALGDFEAILGSEIRRLETDLVSRRLSRKEQMLRIEQTAQALENIRLQEQTLEDDAAGLVAYGDYILNHVQEVRDLHRWVSGRDIRRYVFDHLRLHYRGCEFVKISPSVFDIELSANAKFDLDDFIRRADLPSTTRLASATTLVRCRFDNTVAPSAPGAEEVISQFHPLVKMVRNRIDGGKQQITPAVSLKLTRSAVDAGIESGVHVLAVACWSFRGLQSIDKLAYAVRPLDHVEGGVEPEVAEHLAVAAIAKGRDWPEARNAVDLDRASAVAHELLEGLYQRYETLEREIVARNEDRADVQLRSLEQHRTRRATSLQETLRKHRSLGRIPLVKATQGQLNALEKRFDQQRMRIDRRRRVASSSDDIAIAIINVV